jgi:hypothetical protein
VRKQVEPLEDHADVTALRSDVLVAQPVQSAPPIVVAHQLAVDENPAAVNGLQLVDAA